MGLPPRGSEERERIRRGISLAEWFARFNNNQEMEGEGNENYEQGGGDVIEGAGANAPQ